MDKLKFKIFYDNLYYRPHVAIKINGKDLAKMVMRERSKMISQGMINPFHPDGGVYYGTVCHLAGRYVDALIYNFLTSKNRMFYLTQIG